MGKPFQGRASKEARDARASRVRSEKDASRTIWLALKKIGYGPSAAGKVAWALIISNDKDRKGNSASISLLGMADKNELAEVRDAIAEAVRAKDCASPAILGDIVSRISSMMSEGKQ